MERIPKQDSKTSNLSSYFIEKKEKKNDGSRINNCFISHTNRTAKNRCSYIHSYGFNEIRDGELQ